MEKRNDLIYQNHVKNIKNMMKIEMSNMFFIHQKPEINKKNDMLSIKHF